MTPSLSFAVFAGVGATFSVTAVVLARTDHDDEAQTETVEAEEGDEPTAEQLAAMEAADEASASEAPSED